MRGLPPGALIGGALLLLVIGVMAAQSSGPTYGVQPVNSAAYTAQLGVFQAQVQAEGEARSKGLDTVLQYDAQRKSYDLGVLALQTQAQSEKLQLETAERMFNTGTAAQTQIAQAQISAQKQQSAFGFLGDLAKIVLPFLF